MFDPWVGKLPWRRERLPTPVAKSQTRPSDFHFTSLHIVENTPSFSETDFSPHYLLGTSHLSPPNSSGCAGTPLSRSHCSVDKLCPTLLDPMDCSTPGFPVLHHLPELAQTHVHSVGDAIQTSCPVSSPSLLAFNLLQHQGLF